MLIDPFVNNDNSCCVLHKHDDDDNVAKLSCEDYLSA